MTTATKDVQVKGTPLKSLLRFIEAELTPQQRATALDAMPDDFRERIRRPVLASETYSVHLLNELTTAAAKAKGEALESFARRAGRAGASDAVSGILRVFVLVLTPPAIIKRGGNIWSSVYTSGRLVVESPSERSADIRLEDFPSEKAGCARITGWLERLSEMTGEKNIRIVQTHCFADGAPECRWTIRWG